MRGAATALAIGLTLAVGACREGSGQDPTSIDDQDASAGEPGFDDPAAPPRAHAHTTDAATPDAGAHRSSDDDTARTPATGAEIIAALDSGLVSKELVGTCIDLAEARPGPSGVPLGVAGFHDEDNLVAVITMPWLDPCAPDGDATYRVYEASMPWLHHENESTIVGPAVLEWVQKRVKRGYLMPIDVARWSCEYERWVSPVPGLTLLSEPLDRWMLTVGRGRRSLAVRLIGPSNKRNWDLDPIELKPGVHCEADDTKKGACAHEVGGQVLQLALAPSQRSLVATLLVGTGERCAAGRLVHEVFRLPDAVRSLMPKVVR